MFRSNRNGNTGAAEPETLEKIMSSIWRSILVFLILVAFTVTLGIVFFPGH